MTDAYETLDLRRVTLTSSSVADPFGPMMTAVDSTPEKNA